MAESSRPAADAGNGQEAIAVYALGSSAGESARLQRQADELAACSAALLDRVSLRPGHSAIDADRDMGRPDLDDLHALTGTDV